MTQNRFMKHPKKTLTVFITVMMIISVLGFERYLVWKNKPIDREGIKRHIRLREWDPLTLKYMTPSDNYMNGTDSLIRKEYRLQIDEEGFIYPSRIYDNPDVKIFFLGGSTTECIFVDEKNRFPYLVGRLLENEHRRVNSYNSGISGNNTIHSLDILLNKIIPLNPNIVVMMEDINDLTVLMLEGDYWNLNPVLSPLVYETEETSYSNIGKGLRGVKDLLIPNLYSKIAPIFKKEFGSFFKKEREPDQNDPFANIRGKKILINQQHLVRKFKGNLQTFINICRANGIVPVLMTQANRFKENPDKVVSELTSRLERDYGIKYSQFKDSYDMLNEATRNVGAANGVLVIDLAKKVPQEKDYIYDYDHYNDNGSKFAGRIIASELLNNNLVNSVSKR